MSEWMLLSTKSGIEREREGVGGGEGGRDGGGEGGEEEWWEREREKEKEECERVREVWKDEYIIKIFVYIGVI